jgi:hypothetical protein
VLLWGNEVSPQRLFWSTVLVVVLLVAVQVLVGTAKGADEPSADEPAQLEPLPQNS